MFNPLSRLISGAPTPSTNQAFRSIFLESTVSLLVRSLYRFQGSFRCLTSRSR